MNKPSPERLKAMDRAKNDSAKTLLDRDNVEFLNGVLKLIGTGRLPDDRLFAETPEFNKPEYEKLKKLIAK